jgi:AAA+ superfamily predicted ATPase
MNKTATRAPDPQPDFALELARSTAQGLFDKEWNGFIAMEHDPDDDEDEDDDVIANLPDDVVRPPSKRSWEAPETPLAKTMSETDIAAAISSGCDPWAQSRTGQGRMLRKGDPPASLIATALGLSVLVDSDDHLRGLFAPGHVTNLICPAACLWGLAQILPGAVKQWKSHLSSPKTADLHRYVQDEEEAGRPKSRMRKRGMWGARIERSLAQGASVLIVTTDPGQLDETMTALVSRRVTWPGITPQIVVETLRLTHSATGHLSEADIHRRLPDVHCLKPFEPAQIDAAFAAPTTLKVADRLAEIARKLTRPVPGVTLDSLYGLGDVRRSLDRMLNDLRLWRSGDLSWSDVASSAVFHGPPGTGKTTMARAFAGSAGLPIIETSYSDCQKHGHQGDMLAALDQAFGEAKQAAPAVLFIDELDSFSQRDARPHNADYLRGVVNGLLEQINRTKDIGGLVLFGATNYLDTVDPAVIRSGRFDLKLHVPYPDKRGLEDILAAKLGCENTGGVDTGAIADRLIGLSGADAEAVARDALGRARADGAPVNQQHLEMAADQIAPPLDDDTLWRAAVHEAGHVVVMMRLGWPIPHRVCLTPNGGQVEHAPVKSLTPRTAQERLQVLLAGRAAEICVFDHPSSGAGAGEQSDLAKATSLALAIERHWGFGGSGLLWDGVSAEDVWRAPADVRERVEVHLHEAQDKAEVTLRANRNVLEALAERLLLVRDMSGRDIAAFTEDVFREKHSRNDRAPSEGQPSCVSGS